MFLQDLQATFRVISCNPSTTWMNCCQAASLITMLRPLLSYNAGARGFCLSSFFDKSYWPLRRFWPCGDGDAYCQTFLPQIACTNERNQMPGAEFLISWVGVGGGGVLPILAWDFGMSSQGDPPGSGTSWTRQKATWKSGAYFFYCPNGHGNMLKHVEKIC